MTMHQLLRVSRCILSHKVVCDSLYEYRMTMNQLCSVGLKVSLYKMLNELDCVYCMTVHQIPRVVPCAASHKAAFLKLWSADHTWSSGSALVVLLD